MIKSRIAMLTSSAIGRIGPMSAAERAKGRYMRDESGHAPAPSPAPEATPAPAAPEAPTEVTAESLEAEFSSGNVEPATGETGEEGAPASGEHGPDDSGEPEGQSAQQRIDELTAARRQAERDRDEAVAEAARLRREAEAAAPKPKEGGEKTVDPNAEPKPEDYEYGEADRAFISDTARYHARMEYRREQQQAEMRSNVAELEAGWSQRIVDSKITERFTDFDEKVNKGAERGDWDCSPLMAIGIKASEQGPEIAYHLASNTGEATRISRLTPIEQAREFGRLEARFEYEAASRAAPTPKTTTAAPPPPDGRARGAGGKFTTAADTDDFAAFEAMANGVLKS